MASILSIGILALAVSLDGFGVGVLYGLRKIHIPLLSILMICLCSGLILFMSMQLGNVLLYFIDPSYAEWIGGSILIGIGLWAVAQVFWQKDEGKQAKEMNVKSGTLLHIEIKSLGLVIKILRTPSAADVDDSGTISMTEAAFLGTALSLDALGAGIGAALIGMEAFKTSIMIAAASGLFLAIGLKIGDWFANIPLMKHLSILPGIVLIMLGISKLL